jgi:histone-lysine N-methyltransferase SETDB1
VVKTEWAGSWWNALVVCVDASLVKVSFEINRRTEWIYRGSTRLGPLFAEFQVPIL